MSLCGVGQRQFQPNDRAEDARFQCRREGAVHRPMLRRRRAEEHQPKDVRFTAHRVPRIDFNFPPAPNHDNPPGFGQRRNVGREILVCSSFDDQIESFAIRE
jgi:hypothetical protein